MPTSRPIRLMLVDDHPVMRAGLANLLALQKEFQVVAQADDGESAIALWQQHRPDGWIMFQSEGAEIFFRRTELHPLESAGPPGR